MASAFVPPGGFVGFSQMTPASRAALLPRSGSRSSSRRRRKAAKSKKTRTKRSSGRKLKFGSPAWRKKYAAKAKRNARKARKAK